ncbi:ABC transporter substrate-binding protein, partial [Halomonas sp. 707D7]|nr:ABC transporter substrate-binding protein [Halomonas sp. 707D7]
MRYLTTLAAALGLASTSLALAQPTDSEEALLDAARQEPPLSIYDSTGKIVEQAARFAARYGLQAEGVKSKAPHTLERLIREAQAG